DQARDGELPGRDVHRKSEFTERGGCNGADGSGLHSVEQRWFSTWAKQFHKVLHGRRTSEGHDVGSLVRLLESSVQAPPRTLWYYGFIGFDDIDVSSGFAEFARDHVACDPGADQQDTLPFYFPFQTADDGFGNVFLGHDVDPHAALLDGFLCRRTDRSDAQSATLRR